MGQKKVRMSLITGAQRASAFLLSLSQPPLLCPLCPSFCSCSNSRHS